MSTGLWSRLTGGQMGVLVALLAHAGTDGQCWPSVQRLVTESGQKVRAVQYALARFRELNLLSTLEADADNPRRRFVFLRWSEWALDDQVMAADGAVPAQHTQMHEHAHGVHQDAPRVHGHAQGVHVDAPCIYRNGTEEIEISSSKDHRRSMGQAGLFDDDALVSLLEARGFLRRRAASLASQYGPDRIRQAVTHCDFLQAKGEIRKSYQGALTGFLQHDLAPDTRIAKETAAACRRDQERALAASACQAPTSPPPARQPLSDDARTVAAKEAGVLIRQRDAPLEDRRQIVREHLLASGWSPERWEKAILELNEKTKVSKP